MMTKTFEVFQYGQNISDLELNINNNLIKFLNKNRDQGKSVDLAKFRYVDQFSNITSVVANIVNYLNDCKLGNHYYIYSENKAYVSTDETFVVIDLCDEYNEQTMILVYGNSHTAKNIETKFSAQSFGTTIDWYYKSSYGNIKKQIELKSSYSIQDNHYPFIQPSVNGYIDEYMDSAASVLILMGDPGVGKTSFIRHLINYKKSSAIVTYDNACLSSDDFFISYLLNRENNLMVIEDADVLIQSREKTDNKVMSKLLNISNGLVQLLHKKIIFTTNLQDVSQIDPALIRSGRCHDVLHFRPLTRDEAQVIVDENNLPALPDKKEHTLSDIFNSKSSLKTSSTMGFY